MSKDDSLFTTITVHANRLHNNNVMRNEKTDFLAIEEPLEIRLGYVDPNKGRVHKSISITMRTPGHDQDLAFGFLFAEKIITSINDVISTDCSSENLIRIELADQVSINLSHLERHFYTTSSCGICGKASLEALSLNGAEAIYNNNFKVSSDVLLSLNESLKCKQDLFNRTGGNHATGLFDVDGNILCVTEDVGRHNAMDKLIGQLFAKGDLPMINKGIIVSGRLSFELMQKALMSSCPMIVAVGAPSSLALELAQEYNITLVGFLGDSSFNIYHGAENIF